MVALRLVRLIENHSEELAEEIARKIHTSARTGDMRKIPLEDVQERICEIFRHLSEWLLTKTGSEVERRYLELGARRAAQGISAADLAWAIVFTKEQLWEFLQRQGSIHTPVELYGEMELLWLLNQFFDQAICATIEGHEQEMREAVSSRVGAGRRPSRRSAAGAAH